MTDFLLDTNDDILIANGDFKTGDSLDQEVGLIIRTNPGEWKEDPIMGAGLIRKIKANVKDEEIEQIIRIQLARDGKNYNDLKERIKLNTEA
ncbi:MAG: hypothetical protein COB73_00725 [Flavobacteriaceae bacterium]|nr:MAG: hypothetical protein COB73_00725 [Flavobacteriaceae bacterium]